MATGGEGDGDGRLKVVSGRDAEGFRGKESNGISLAWISDPSPSIFPAAKPIFVKLLGNYHILLEGIVIYY